MTKKEAELYIAMLEVAHQESLSFDEAIELGKKVAKKYNLKLDLSLV